LVSLHARGVRPDREALATASEAEERGRAYLGRYFVAVTVLVGLVGTFAGLMETLRTIGPLVSEGSTLQLLQAPLAGLDVTFGASVVGILVTLALALVQGDLVLVEELTLARLEERTTHLLVPELWPPSHAADERTASELAQLRKDVERLGERAADRMAARLAEVLQTSTRTHLDALAQATQATLETLAKTTQLNATALANATAQQSTALANATAQHAGALAASHEATENALRATIGEAGARLQATSSSLAEAVGGLRGVADALSPMLAQLGPELNALAREVSLLAARGDGGEDPLIADELVRLGEGVERLETLLRMAQA
jgi:hypothetical protein